MYFGYNRKRSAGIRAVRRLRKRRGWRRTTAWKWNDACKLDEYFVHFVSGRGEYVRTFKRLNRHRRQGALRAPPYLVRFGRTIRDRRVQRAEQPETGLKRRYLTGHYSRTIFDSVPGLLSRLFETNFFFCVPLGGWER